MRSIPSQHALLTALALLACSCQAPPGAASAQVKPVYNNVTGRLEQLTSDRDGDGKIDTRAFMDGVHLKYIEIDRNGDGRPDRWEYYAVGTSMNASLGTAFDKATILERAEEANGPDQKVTRREFYDHGVIQRVEEDTDFDGRVDKWERYENGSLAQMDLDLEGHGKADRRFVYRPDGSLDHMEADAKGDGSFQRMPAAPETPASGRKGGGA